MAVDRSSLPSLRRRVLLIGLPMAGGAGLAMHILADLSLPLAILVFAASGAVVWLLVMKRLPARTWRAVRRRALVGVVAGAIGTVAYDAARYGIVSLFSMSFRPFHVLSLFGEAFIGHGHGEAVTFAVGALYHLSNGTFFGLAYTLVFREPAWWTGALWGIGLELCMATLYPSWLRVVMLREFLEVSAIGHVVYGSVLGVVAARGVAQLRQRDATVEVEP